MGRIFFTTTIYGIQVYDALRLTCGPNNDMSHLEPMKTINIVLLAWWVKSLSHPRY